VFHPPDSFVYDVDGSDLVYGRNAVADFGDRLATHGLDRALVVCGSNVGANAALMEPVRAGLGDRLVGVYDGTTPEKSVETAYDALEAAREVDADVVVGLGGGSSLNVARLLVALAADGRSLADLRADARDGGLDPIAPDSPPMAVAVVPTTFAGADISAGGSLRVLPAGESPTGQPVHLTGAVQPTVILEDPALFETTPYGALAGSAMNGFDKGVETTYAAAATSITDATATYGLELLADSLPRLGVGDDGVAPDPSVMERAVAGAVLVQFECRTSVVHAVGHGFTRRFDVQQGVAHAVVVPHVLRYLYDEVDGRREVLADGLGIDTAGRSAAEVAAAVIDRVTATRDGLGLPSRLRELDPVAEDDLPDVARFVVDDPTIEGVPEGLDPTVEDIEGVLRAAW